MGSSAGSGTSLPGSLDIKCVVHDGPVLGTCYMDDGGKLLSCGDDKRVAILNLEEMISNTSYMPDYCIGHTKAVNKVRSYGSKIWSCSRDLSLRMVLFTTHYLSNIIILL